MATVRDIDNKIARHRREITIAQQAIEQLVAARSVVAELDGEHEPLLTTSEMGDQGLTRQQQAVYASVPLGFDNRLKPGQIIDAVNMEIPVDASYLRTTLWRMAQAGRLKSENGRYWKDDVG